MSFGSLSLYGETLSPPLLRFDYVSPSCVSETAYRGLNRFGAYDKSTFDNKTPDLAIVYPVGLRSFIPQFKQFFVRGYNRYPGLRKWFLIDVNVFDEYVIQYTNKPEDYLKEVEEIISEDYDFAFIIIERREISRKIYSLLKSELLANGIPSQFINSDRLKLDSNFEWILMNLAISFYAKIGGTPWVISAEENSELSPEIVVGISRAMDKDRKFIIGYTTIYKNNGDFILSRFHAPVSKKENYEEHIKSLVEKSIEAYRREQGGEPETIVCHFHKKTSNREIEAVAKGLKDVASDAKFALIHLNSYSNYRLFDTSHNTFVPCTGLMVKLGSRQAILLTTGREKTGKTRMGTPVPFEITMDKRSTLGTEHFYKLVKQIYNFSRINWRGLNATTIPVTINYSSLIAKLLGNIGDVDDWNRIVSNGSLTKKTWFL